MRDERFLRADEPLAGATVGAIRGGDVDALGRLLQDHPGLAGVRLRVEDDAGRERITRTLLHVATDWPGHFPNVGATMRVLVAAGAAVDARNDPGTETPLHWAASGDDIEALDALVDAGADIEAPGAVIGHGGQRSTAEYLLGRGANLNWVSVWDGLTPLDAARREGADDLATWLVTYGARSAEELTSSEDGGEGP